MKKTINKKADLQSLVDVFKALGDSSRLKIFNILISANSNLCVGMIAHNLSMTQPAVSQHLRILKNSGLVTSGRYGFHVHYKINIEKLNKIKEAIDQLINNVTFNYSNDDPCASYPNKKDCV